MKKYFKDEISESIKASYEDLIDLLSKYAKYEIEKNDNLTFEQLAKKVIKNANKYFIKIDEDMIDRYFEFDENAYNLFVEDLEKKLQKTYNLTKVKDISKDEVERLIHTFGSEEYPIKDKYFSHYIEFYNDKLYLWLIVEFDIMNDYNSTFYQDYKKEISLKNDYKTIFNNCENSLTDLLIDAQNDLSYNESLFYSVRYSLKSYQ